MKTDSVRGQTAYEDRQLVKTDSLSRQTACEDKQCKRTDSASRQTLLEDRQNKRTDSPWANRHGAISIQFKFSSREIYCHEK